MLVDVDGWSIVDIISTEWDLSAASSTKRSSRMRTSWILLFDFRRTRLKRLPLFDVGAIFRVPEGARQYEGEEDSEQGGRERHPCLTPLLEGKAFETALSYNTVPFTLQ